MFGAEKSITMVGDLRTTLILPENLAKNLKFYSANNGVKEGEIIKEALRDFLKKKGYQPDKAPKGSKPVYE